MIDIAVVGAGMAGLICAQYLQQKGYRVVVIEKSRGLGGRVATRRLQETGADHGLRYLENQGTLTQRLIETLQQQGILQRWANTPHEFNALGLYPLLDVPAWFVAPAGMTTIAKFLAAGLEIWRNQRVSTICPTSEQTWKLTLEADPQAQLTAKAIVVAIPAPQALMLLEPLSNQGLPASFVQALRSIEFDPCLTAIATYSPEHQTDLQHLSWRSVCFSADPNLAWLAIDSSKRSNSTYPVCILHSTAAFAARHLEAIDLKPIGHQLLATAQPLLNWMTKPESLQVHRWRYAFVRHPWHEKTLKTSTPLPIVCSGDWCGGYGVESALESGLAAAAQVIAALNDNPGVSDAPNEDLTEMLKALSGKNIQ